MFTFKHDAYLFSDVVTSIGVAFQTRCWKMSVEKAVYKKKSRIQTNNIRKLLKGAEKAAEALRSD